MGNVPARWPRHPSRCTLTALSSGCPTLVKDMRCLLLLARMRGSKLRTCPTASRTQDERLHIAAAAQWLRPGFHSQLCPPAVWETGVLRSAQEALTPAPEVQEAGSVHTWPTQAGGVSLLSPLNISLSHT